MSIELEDRVRDGLHRLVGAEAATPFDVQELVAEGRRRRRRRTTVAAVAGTMAAVLTIGALGALVTEETGVRPAPAATLPEVGSRLPTAPPVIGELARVEFPEQSTARALQPAEGVPYVLLAACTSPGMAGQVTITLRAPSGAVLHSTAYPCDWKDYYSGVLPELGAQVSLDVTATPRAQGFVLIVPGSSLDYPLGSEVARIDLGVRATSDPVILHGKEDYTLLLYCLADDRSTEIVGRVVDTDAAGTALATQAITCDGQRIEHHFRSGSGKQRVVVRVDGPDQIAGVAVLVRGTDAEASTRWG